NVPVGLAAMALVVRRAPAPAPRAATLDLASQASGAVALAALTFALIEAGARGWDAPAVLGGFAVCVAALLAFAAAWSPAFPRSSSPWRPSARAWPRACSTRRARSARRSAWRCSARSAACTPRRRWPAAHSRSGSRQRCGYDPRVAISEELGERRTVEVGAGVVEYRERGSGPALVFAHGAAVNGDLWREVVPAVADTYRCITLDVPLGGHAIALRPDADLSLFGVAAIVADVIDALALDDVTLVG